MLPISPALQSSEAFRPLTFIADGILLTTREVAKHYRVSEQSLVNERRLNKGRPHIRLPTGSVRYRAGELIEWEISGHRGALSIDRVALGLATCPGISPAQRALIESHLRKVLCSVT